MDEAYQQPDAYLRKSAASAGLTEKQCEVLELLIEHKTSKEIARELGISPHTVDQRLMFARDKLGARNRTELATIYRELVSRYPQSTYGFPDMDAAGPAGETAAGVQGSVPSRESAAEPVPRVVPAAFDGSSGTLLRVASVVAIALLLLLVVLGSFALYEQVARMVGQ